MEKSELLQLQTNANQPDNSTSSKEDRTIRIELPNTPYYVVGNSEEGYCITFGKYKISETFIKNEAHYLKLDEIEAAAYEYLDLYKYNILFHTMCAVQNVHTELTKDTNKQN